MVGDLGGVFIGELPHVFSSMGMYNISWLFISAFMFGQVSGILINISFGEMYSRDGTGDPGDGLLLVLDEKDCFVDSLVTLEHNDDLGEASKKNNLKLRIASEPHQTPPSEVRTR